jgi:hypothetical protein
MAPEVVKEREATLKALDQAEAGWQTAMRKIAERAGLTKGPDGTWRNPPRPVAPASNEFVPVLIRARIVCSFVQGGVIDWQRLKLDGHRECRDVPLEPIHCLELEGSQPS